MDSNLMTEDELDCQLAAADPVVRPALDAEPVRSALAGIRNSVELSTPAERGVRHPIQPSRHRQRVVMGVAASAVVVAASLVGLESLTGGGGSSLPFSVQSAAAAQLNKVANAAAQQPVPGPGQWIYRETQTKETLTATAAGHSVAYSYTELDQGWDSNTAPQLTKVEQREASDGFSFGRGRERKSGISFSFLTPQDRATYLANRAAFDATAALGQGPMKLGLQQDHFETTVTGGPGTGQPWQAVAATSDPKTLLSELWSQVGTGQQSTDTTPSATTTTPQEGTTTTPYGIAADNFVQNQPRILWAGLIGLLGDSTSSPEMRATAYRAMAYIPDTSVVGQATDSLGRSGLEVNFTGYQGINFTVIVSPTTGALLESTETLTRASRGLPAGIIEERDDYYPPSIVSSPTALPNGGTQPLDGTSGN